MLKSPMFLLAGALMLLLGLSGCVNAYDNSKWQNPSVRGGYGPGSATAVTTTAPTTTASLPPGTVAGKTARTTGLAYIKAGVALQNDALDRLMGEQSVSAVYTSFRDALKNRTLTPVVGERVVLQLRRGAVLDYEFLCMLGADGTCGTAVDVSKIRAGSSLCVVTEFPLAKQKKKPDYYGSQNANCVDGLYDYFVMSHKGDTEEGRYIVYVVKRGG